MYDKIMKSLLLKSPEEDEGKKKKNWNRLVTFTNAGLEQKLGTELLSITKRRLLMTVALLLIRHVIGLITPDVVWKSTQVNSAGLLVAAQRGLSRRLHVN